MLTSVMFYQTDGSELSFSQKMFVAVVSIVIVAPPVSITIFFFKSARLTSKSPKGGKHKGFLAGFLGELAQVGQRSSRQVDAFSTPFYFRYIAWTFCLGSAILASYWVVLYGLSFGAAESSAWLQTFIISVVLSIFLTQPLKVLILAVVVSFLYRRHSDGDRVDSDVAEKSNTPVPSMIPQVAAIETMPGLTVSKQHMLNRRAEVLREKKIKALTNKLLIYLIFFSVLAFLVTSHHDGKSYTFKRSISQALFDRQDGDSNTQSFANIDSDDKFWLWIESVFSKGIVWPLWYNERAAFEESVIHDSSLHQVGASRHLQLRVTSDSCTVPSIMLNVTTSCLDSWSLSDNEVSTLYPHLADGTWDTSSKTYWQYHSSDELGGSTYVGRAGVYGGGGYTQILPWDSLTTLDILSYLKRVRWVDEQTRAVFFESILYSPSFGSFMYVQLVTEFPPASGAITSFNMITLNIGNFGSDLDVLKIIIDILLILFFSSFLYVELKKVYRLRRKYFTSFSNCSSLFISLFAVLTIAFYSLQYVKSKQILASLEVAPRDEYVSEFATVAYYGQVINFVAAFTLFFATIKLLDHARHVSIVNFFIRLCKEITVPLIGYCVLLLLLVVCYAILGYLAFGAVSFEFHTVHQAMYTLQAASIGASEFETYVNLNRLLGPAYFWSFNAIVVFIVISIIVTILQLGLQVSREIHQSEKDNIQILSYYYDLFKKTFGFGDKSHHKPPSVEENVADINTKLTSALKRLN